METFYRHRQLGITLTAEEVIKPVEGGWGYGVRPRTEEEFHARFRGLTEALLFNPGVAGLCYTQLTDVEQEVNGLLTYGRRMKFAPELIAAVLRQPAAAER